MRNYEPTLLIDDSLFSQTLKAAIKKRGLTYGQATDLVRVRLPEGFKLSGVSLWNYANGKTLPRRPDVLAALCDEFNIQYVDNGNERARESANAVARQTVEEFEDAGYLLLKASGSGLAVIRFAAELEWDKAFEIVQILRRIEALPSTAYERKPESITHSLVQPGS